MALDSRDRLMLAELLRDGRASHVELADRVGLSPTACARRLRALEDRGVIIGHQVVVDTTRLGFSTTVLVRVTLNSQAEDTLDSFEKAITACPSVVSCFLMSGTDDYLLTILARNIEDFEQIHRSQLSRLPGVGRIQSSFAIREVVKRSLPPAALAQR